MAEMPEATAIAKAVMRAGTKFAASSRSLLKYAVGSV